ncbi:MAG: hypothetical protein BroJett040_21210 [Oligoflexia bacterium]|nr:MAG: hypothetical protein BroJett040_21210 [Oligoflexia bacterium]
MQIRLLILFLTALFSLQTQAGPLSKSDAVRFLQNWRIELNSKISEDLDNPELTERTKTLELDTRKELIDRVIFHVQSRQQQTINKQSFDNIIENMLETSQSQKNKAFTRDGQFLENMAHILKEAVEPNENPLEVMQNYMNYSGVLKPEKPENFLNERNYINGNQSDSGNPMDLDQAASLVDSKIFGKNLEQDQSISTD